MVPTMNPFEKFLNHRQSLLVQYKMGDLTKSEFIKESYFYMESLGIRPFTRIDNVKKAVYNYHYHNVNAKYWQWLKNDPRNTPKERQAYQIQSEEQYRMKDQVTLALLRLIDFNAEAYYVNVKSPNLKGRLIEIVIRDPDILLEIDSRHSLTGSTDTDYLILHSMGIGIANALRANGILKEDKRKSLTDGYINQKY